MAIKIKKNAYSDNDTDLEHLSRSSYDSLPPRVLIPGVLNFYGLNLYIISLMHKFITQSLEPLKDEKKIYFTGIKERYLRRPNESKLHLPSSYEKRKIRPAEGWTLLRIDTSVASGKQKEWVDIRHLPEKWQFAWNVFFWKWLDEFMENIYPKHIHFLLKDSIMTPLPFKYFEFFLKFENGNMGNLCADFKHGDTIEDSVLK